MAFLENLAIIVSQNLPVFWFVAFFATALWGDATFILLTILSINFHIPLWIIFSAAFFGTLLGDTLWFLLGVKFLINFEKHKKFGKHYRNVVSWLRKIFGKKYLSALTIVKFLYGTRVITIMYLANERIGYRKFMRYNLIATALWTMGVGAIGILAGLGFTLIINVFKNVQLAITLLIVIIIIINLIQRKITERVERLNN